MENQELKITVEKGISELTILHGQAEPKHHDNGILIADASIEAAYEYLSKLGVTKEDIINSKLEFSYKDLYINLFYSLRRPNPDTIRGSLKLHSDLLKFKINQDKTYSTFELSDFIKMNRHYFENKDIAMKLVSELRSFEGKVNKEIELKADTRANQRTLIHQVVESNIPSSFILVVPVFLGQPKVRLEIEINITADFSCSLISPDLKQIVDEQTKVIIDGELGKIRKIHPDLKIFEK